jgi:hypothetical protein
MLVGDALERMGEETCNLFSRNILELQQEL